MEKVCKVVACKVGLLMRYEFFCIHPTAPNYHILMDCAKPEPIRMYNDDFNKLRRTDRAAVQQAIHYHESYIESIRKEYAKILDNKQD